MGEAQQGLILRSSGAPALCRTEHSSAYFTVIFNYPMNTRLKPAAVIFARDIDTLARFYRETAEMTEVHRDSDHVVLNEDGFQVVVHAIPKQIAATIEITSPPEVREETPIKICLPVSNIERARAKAAELGGNIGPKSKEWAAWGFRACDGCDPEGNVFQVRESAASHNRSINGMSPDRVRGAIHSPQPGPGALPLPPPG